ncbi:endonuclease/exonuclease/phosphatase family protein [Phytopseudomonas dryadis]|uniref:Endonuclease/exonuclease/phosphatase family protein n=1 Tax=Phytopseudomonas dryadis TaxID=2487520 RepID=A0A4Q9R5M1_9GAMM|nr:endonuclease/exonuclease/phosphatase family protein [Pseudomonas dryadis]TBU95653.1 endonuclease/exonuclease/phosphatase family protein [Pseudomonas dryadis]
MYSIMIWNTQHFDNQKGNYSQAYTDKKKFLEFYISKKKPHIIALFEVGKTGNINESLIADLTSSYTAIATLVQEGGKKKHTTLGSMVLVRNDVSTEFENVTDNYILSHTEQRAPLIIRHIKSTFGFAFYHANASFMAPGNIVDTIGFIQNNAEALKIKKLLFFGGDLNLIPTQTYEEIKGMKRLVPTNPGYTHLSIKNVTLEEAAHELSVIQSYGKDTHLSAKNYLPEYMFTQGIEACDLQPVLLLLDYAYVLFAQHWRVECDASLRQNSDSSGNVIEISPYCLNHPIRSDHFPVLFTLNAMIE